MQIHFFATYRQIVGTRVIEMPAGPGITVRALVEALVVRYPDLRREWLDDQGELQNHVHIFVNGREVKFLPDGMQTVLTDADDVKIFPPVGGG